MRYVLGVAQDPDVHPERATKKEHPAGSNLLFLAHWEYTRWRVVHITGPLGWLGMRQTPVHLLFGTVAATEKGLTSEVMTKLLVYAGLAG